MPGLQLAYHQGDQSADAECRPHPDLVTAKPVFALALVEYHLQHPESQRQKANTPQIYSAGLVFADVMRVTHKGANHQHRKYAHRQVEIEDPAPGVVVGDIAAERGAENGREDDAEPKRRHRRAVPLGRKGLQQDSLGQRLQSATRETLQNAEEDEPIQAGSHPAEQRGQRETGDAGQKNSTAAEAVRQPARHWQDDGIRHQIGSDNPGSSSTVAPMFPAMWGMETFTTVVSRISMNVPNMTAMVTIQGFTCAGTLSGISDVTEKILG